MSVVDAALIARCAAELSILVSRPCAVGGGSAPAESFYTRSARAVSIARVVLRRMTVGNVAVESRQCSVDYAIF